MLLPNGIFDYLPAVLWRTAYSAMVSKKFHNISPKITNSMHQYTYQEMRQHNITLAANRTSPADRSIPAFALAIKRNQANTTRLLGHLNHPSTPNSSISAHGSAEQQPLKTKTSSVRPRCLCNGSLSQVPEIPAPR